MAYVSKRLKPRILARQYGEKWSTADPMMIELGCIRMGGTWKNRKKEECGQGLFHHFKEFAKLRWPDDQWTKWDDLMLAEFVKGGFLAVAGPSSSWKTSRASKYALTLYWAFPKETTILVSTTTIEDLEKRIWGEIKKYFRISHEFDMDKFGYHRLAGNLIESRQSITTDGKDVEGRDFRNGLKGCACKKGNAWVGISAYAGCKNKRMALVCDEGPLMEGQFFDGCANLCVNPWFQLITLGNPKDPMDSFGRISEPKLGWDSIQMGVRTQTWETRFLAGRCLNLVGTDAPNLDFPEGEEPFKDMIGRRYINQIAHDYGVDSWQYKCWVLAAFPSSVMERRVITRALCLKFGAYEEAVWSDSELIHVFGLDAAYGSVGGDRCVGIHVCFGKERNGQTVLSLVGRPMVIPVDMSAGIKLPEDQIVEFVKQYCETHNIPASHVIFDGTGRSSLTSAFCRLWSVDVKPLEFGGKATDRPAPNDIHKMCREVFSKFVTELWYSVRSTIESGQFRGITEELVHEGQLRAWDIVKDGKVEVEPKEETKKRLGRSPDLFDALVCAVEGARQFGFRIAKLGKSLTVAKHKWIVEASEKYRAKIKDQQLVYR